MPSEVSTFGTSLPKIRQTRKLRPMTESDLPESIELSKNTPGPACGGPERSRSALGTRSGTQLRDSVAAQRGSKNHRPTVCQAVPSTLQNLPMKIRYCPHFTDGESQRRGSLNHLLKVTMPHGEGESDAS